MKTFEFERTPDSFSQFITDVAVELIIHRDTVSELIEPDESKETFEIKGNVTDTINKTIQDLGGFRSDILFFAFGLIAAEEINDRCKTEGLNASTGAVHLSAQFINGINVGLSGLSD